MARDLVRQRRYIQKFYQMRTQLQAVGLRIQTLRSNQQMAEAMKGATRVRLAPNHFTSAKHRCLTHKVGHGQYEQGHELACHSANHERV
jgi:hypothetical protein